MDVSSPVPTGTPSSRSKYIATSSGSSFELLTTRAFLTLLNRDLEQTRFEILKFCRQNLEHLIELGWLSEKRRKLRDELKETHSCLGTPEKLEKTHEVDKMILGLHGTLAEKHKLLLTVQ